MEKKALTVEQLKKSNPWIDPEFQQPIEISDPGAALKAYLKSKEGQDDFARLDPQAAAKADEHERIGVWEEFKTEARNHGLPYFACEKNDRALSAMIEGSFGDEWTVENLRGAWARLVIAGKGILNPDEPRLLTQEDEIRISRMAATGDMQNALAEYLRCRFPRKDVRELERADAAEYEEILSKTALQPLIKEAFLFTWFAGHPDVPETDELTKFFQEFTSKKLVITFATLDELHDQFVKLQEREQHAALFAPEPTPTPEQTITTIEDMADAEVSETMAAVRKAYATRR
jgi:hypothetical protein